MPSQLTTLANVKAFLALGTSVGAADDPLLSRLITAVSQYIETACNRTFAAASYTETRNGNRGRAMAFRQTPVTAVASLVIDTVTIPARPNSLSFGYSFDENVLYLDGFSFGSGKQSVVLSYTAGYASIPYDLEQAAIMLTSLVYRGRDRIGVTGKGIGPEHISYLVGKIPADVCATIDQYSRVLAPW
jgi:hypothetical protein